MFHNDNLSFIIDYFYQKYIEKVDQYETCIYDMNLLSMYNLDREIQIKSRFKLSDDYNINYCPYKINDSIIYNLCLYIEITRRNYTNQTAISNHLIDVKFKDNPSIIYFDYNKLLLDNNFNYDVLDRVHKIQREITTLDILNLIRKKYVKRNKIQL